MARRLPVSRRRAVGASLWTGLSARLAAGSMILFVVSCLAAHWFLVRADRDSRRLERCVADWAARLMHGAVLTPYGWLPRESTTREVDAALNAHGARFVMLDPSSRVVRASQSLQDGPPFSIPATDAADVPGLGRAEILRTPLTQFGRPEGEFVVLKPLGSALPAPGPWSGGYTAPRDDPARSPDWRFLSLGAVLVGAGTFTLTQLLAGTRLRRMLRVAATPSTRTGGGRRFAESGDDEIGRLSDALDTLLRQSRRALHTMGHRETNRRDWLSELSHDLRTPLAALQLRLDNARKAGAGDLRAAVSKAAKDCARIQELANGFMDLAELEVTEDFACEPVMPEELISRVHRGLQPIAGARDVLLHTRAGTHPTIFVDGHRMLRALENMTRNAIRHARSKVVLGAEQHGEQLHFFVLDDGEGFDLVQEAERIDYDEWRGRTRPRGLGLRVADRVARAHGGRLVITNRPTGTLVECVIDMVTEPDPDWPKSANGSHTEKDA